MSVCVITTQVVVTLLASWSSIKARQWGRKSLLLIAFGVLPVRGLLYTLTNAAPSLVAIQILDGIAAAIFGMVSVLVIADLTKGTGRFSLTLGAVTTAVGIGAAVSQGGLAPSNICQANAGNNLVRDVGQSRHHGRNAGTCTRIPTRGRANRWADRARNRKRTRRSGHSLRFEPSAGRNPDSELVGQLSGSMLTFTL